MAVTFHVKKLAQTYRGPSHEIYFDLVLNGTYETGGIPFYEKDFSVTQKLVALAFYYHPQYHIFWDSEQYPYRIVLADRTTMQELPNNTPLNEVRIKGKATSAAI